MNGPGESHTERVSQVEKDEYHMMSLTRGNWKKATHELLNTYIFLKTKIELQM